eukprot:1975840-Lingulodinium_polyedra.AAC.1
MLEAQGVVIEAARVRSHQLADQLPPLALGELVPNQMRQPPRPAIEGHREPPVDVAHLQQGGHGGDV